MDLKKIEMQGFKSFADKIAIELDMGITAIVGPNGSGKSNISDAVRWVLGEQSIKSLRGTKMEDVIFSGTEHRKPSGFAEVTLLFENADGGLRAPYSEVSVTRRVYRSGDSEYLINRSQCRLKDITELFYDTGVGREGYTIIGQGKVDEILNNKPEDRRGIFEEAAGIMKYKVRRQEAERKLEATSQNLLRIRDIIGELGSQMEILGEQARTAQQYLRLRDELKEIEVAGYVSSIGKFEAALKRLESDISAARDEYDKQAAALKAAEEQAGQKDLLAAQLDERQAALNEEIRAIEARLSDISNQISLNNEKASRAQADIERVRGEIERTGERKAGHGAELLSNRNKLSYLSSELSRYGALLDDKKIEYDAVLSALGDSDRLIEELKQGAQAARDKYYDDKNRLSGMFAEREHFTRAIAAVDKNHAAAVREIDADNLAMEELGDEQARARAVSDALHAALKGMSLKRAELNASLEARKGEIGKLASQLDAKRSRAKILTDMENSFEGFYASVRRVLAECKRRPDFGAGVCGAVATLINVSGEYETAISMVLGAAQQNIVTEDDRSAERAIDFLKRTSGGRATFLPISSVRGRSIDAATMGRLADKAGYIGVAADLISYDAKYDGVMRELLGATVVVDRLDNALAVAAQFRRQFRIVTLDGDIVTTSGAITGGSVEAGNSGILSRHREIPELLAEAQKIEAEITAKKRDADGQESELGALVAAIADKEKAQNAHQAVNAALAQKATHLEEKLNTDKARRDILKLELDEAKRGRSELEKAVAALEESTEAQADELAKTQSVIDEYAEKHREGQQSRDELLADISAYNVSVASISEAHKAVSENIARLEAELADSDRGIAAREAAIQKFGRDIEKYRAESDILGGEQAKAEQVRQGAQLRLESAASEKAALREDARAITDEIAGINGVINGISRELSRYEARGAKAKAELDHCVNRLWEDYELTYGNALAMLPGEAVTMLQEDDAAADDTIAADAASDATTSESDASNADDAASSDAATASSFDPDDAATSESGTSDADDDSDADGRTLNPPLIGEAAAKRSAKLREQMRALGPVNVLSIDEYAQTKERLEKMEAQGRDLEEAGDKLRQLVAEMSQIMSKNFKEQFELINANFDIVFKELFSGGRARLILSEGRDILEAGVEIEIQLPGKRMQNMMLYSGGERALTAIALIFAMLMLKPAPFCLLDEIESALDEANVERFSRYIRKYSNRTQFIMVTHRKGTMEGSNVLYGVTMQERGVSGVVSLRLSDAS